MKIRIFLILLTVMQITWFANSSLTLPFATRNFWLIDRIIYLYVYESESNNSSNNDRNIYSWFMGCLFSFADILWILGKPSKLPKVQNVLGIECYFYSSINHRLPRSKHLNYSTHGPIDDG